MGMSGAVTGARPAGPAQSLPSIIRLTVGESIPAENQPRALQWLAPAVRLFAFSWVSCIIFGFLPGDIVLVYALLLLSSCADLVLCFTSGNPRVRQNSWPETVSSLGWALPLAFVFAGLALRTGSVSLARVISFQEAYGVLLGSTVGGALALAGSWLLFLVSLMCAVSLMRTRPFGRDYFGDAPGGIAWDTSGAPLALLRLSEAASLFVVPLLLVALFLAGPVSNWYEAVFWGLKLTGIFLLLALFDTASAGLRSDGVLSWLLGAGSLVAIVGLLLIRFGVY